MGAYLKYKLVNPSKAEEADSFLDEQEEQQKIREIDGRSLWFWTEKDREIEQKKLEENGNGVPDWLDIGEGNFKASGIGMGIADKNLDLVANLFKKLHKNYEVKVLSNSCALRTDYFTPKQISVISKNGEALSGEEKDRVRKIINN